MVRREGSEEFILLSNGVARSIDADSASHFRVSNISNVEVVDGLVLNQFRRGRPISPIKRMDVTPDENHRIALLRIDAQQNRIIRKIEYLAGGVKNPSFVLWAGRQLMISQHIYDKPS